MGILTKYVPDEESKPNEADEQNRTDSQPETDTATASATATTARLPEYFSMKLISLIHEVCAGEQFEDITAPDFYACMNLHPCQCVLKIKPREKIRVCYLISLMREQLPGQDKDKWKEAILKHLDIDEDYYKSKYREPVSDLPSIPNQKFAKEISFMLKYSGNPAVVAVADAVAVSVSGWLSVRLCLSASFGWFSSSGTYLVRMPMKCKLSR